MKGLKELSAFLVGRASQQQSAFTSAQAQATAIEDPQEKAKALDEAKKLAESEASKQLRAKLTEVLKEGLNLYVWKQYLNGKVPRFLYFDEYYQMDGQLNIQKLKQRHTDSNFSILTTRCLR